MSAQRDILQSTASLHRSWESDWNLQEIQPLEGKKVQIPALGMHSSAPSTLLAQKFWFSPISDWYGYFTPWGWRAQIVL